MAEPVKYHKAFHTQEFSILIDMHFVGVSSSGFMGLLCILKIKYFNI
jgi:hypothetical protein